MITRVTLEEVGCHTSLDLTLGASAPSSVALCGGNGTGKSTVLAAVAFGLSGDPTWVSGLAALAGGDAAKPRVTLGLRPDPAHGVAVLSRTLPGPGHKRAARRLEYGGQVWSADAEIAAELERWLGLPPKEWGRLAVVRQGRLLDVVDAQPSVRKTALARALGIDHAAKVADALRLEEQAVANDLDTDRLLADAGARAAAAYAEHQQALAVLAATPGVTDGELQTASIRVERADRAYTQAARRAELDRLGSAAAARYSDCIVRRDACLGEAGQDDSHTLFAKAVELEAEADRIERLKSLEAERDQAAERHCRLMTTPDPGPAPLEPVELTTARDQLGLWRAVASLTPGCPCPTCHRPVDGDLATAVGDARSKLVAYETANTTHTAAVKAHAVARAAYETAMTAKARLADRLADCERRLTAEPRPPDGFLLEPGVLRARATDTRTRANHVKQRRKDAEDYDRAAAIAKHELDTAAAEFRALPPAGPLDDPTAAREALASLRVAGEAHTKAATTVQLLESRAAAESAAVTRARAVAAGSEARREHRERLGRLRGAFHPDAAPAALMAAYVADKVEAVNLWLAKLAARFRVTAGPELDFIASFADGSPGVPADRLSGGEKGVLAWAWTAATAATRLLCLDEPTYGLDGARLDALRSAVAGWRTEAPECQLLIVTHDRRLADMCDVVLDLGAQQ